MQIDPHKASLFLKAVSDETRLKILLLLMENELNVAVIVQSVGKAQPTISLDLKLLESAGIVQKRALGKRRLYTIRPDRKDAVSAILAEVGAIES